MDRIEALLERIADSVTFQPKHQPWNVREPMEVPLVDGCRIVHRGDGFDVCRVHFRYWKTGTQMCPGSQGR
jgi:hypothetical protein